MRKSIRPEEKVEHPTGKLDPFRVAVHELWEESYKAIQKNELDVYIGDDNLPKIKALEQSDDVSVEDVLIIGGFLALNKLHATLHELDAADIMSGKLDIRELLPEDMPDELKDIVSDIAEVIKKRRGK